MKKKRIRRYLRKKIPKTYTALENIYHKVQERLGVTKPVSYEAPVNPSISKNTIADSIVPRLDRKNRILLLGRIKEGDSIANHTRAFLLTIDFSAFDYFLYDEYSHTLFFCDDMDKLNPVKTCYPQELDPGFFDIMIYLNVLDNCTEEYPFEDRVPPQGAYISFAYPVFDGTIPPFQWIKIINKYFDGIIVPCNNLKKIFEDAGVQKPVFELPEALDLSPYMRNKKDEESKTYTFGWSGTFETRKNPIKIIKAFKKAFGDDEKVKLVIHTRFIDKKTTEGALFEEVNKGLPKNIRIIQGVLSDSEYISLINSFDAYVYVSMGEGYSITPRQAMASGAPLILSSIPTHKDITDFSDEDGVFWVNANREVEAIQPSLNNLSCGKMYDIDEDELSNAMRRLYSRCKEIMTDSNIRKRRKEAYKYDIRGCRERYRSIFFPHKLELGTDNVITSSGLITNDNDLLVKYKYYKTNVNRKIIVCPAHDGGFCSVFNKWMSHRVYAPDTAILLPDWRLKTIIADVQNRTGKKEFVSFCYGTTLDKNIFYRCFGNPYTDYISEDVAETSLMYQVADVVLDSLDFNVKNEPNLTYVNAYNLYNDKEYFDYFRNRYHQIYKKYIRLIPEMENKIEAFYEHYLKGKFVISAQIRSAAHSSELKENDRPTFELYEKHLLAILEDNGMNEDSDDWRMFIASDSSKPIEYFTIKYKKHIVSQKMQRLSIQDDKEYMSAKEKAGVDIEGFGLQHRAAKDPTKWTLNNAYDILFDVNILAKADYFIFVMSNISTMVSYVNPDVEMVYCK